MESIYFKVSIPKILIPKLLAKIFPAVYYSWVSHVRFVDIPKHELQFYT